jgi:AcrR family transcriptional regulator
MTDQTPRLRRDAAENLEKVLDVATEVFAREGIDTSIEVVARRAEVGLGTVYRRFRNKEALVEELARRLLARAVDIAERHLSDPDGSGLFGYLWEIGELLASQSGIVGRMWNVPGAAELVERSRELQHQLVAAAVEHGHVRTDVVAEDVAVLCWSISGVLDVARRTPSAPWRRHVEICIDGLRPVPTQLAEPPLTGTEMDAIIDAQGRPDPR